jgi:hypothetical protein
VSFGTSAVFVALRILVIGFDAGRISGSAAIGIGDSAATYATAVSADGLRPNPIAFATVERRSE